MIANLPLLFANGNPTALSKISAPELEKFISFMVTCSWGHDTAKDIRQPPWWPEDVTFSHPFRRPAVAPKDWENRLKRLVRKCYDYHKSAFLLVFSAQLARLPRSKLRYVDNLDRTTSLYCKPSGKLLVTFRNENLYYDKNTDYVKPDLEEFQAKPSDIYLCDNCDSHFDNLDVLNIHERLCNTDTITPGAVGGLPEFLSALKLMPLDQDQGSAAIYNSDIRPRHARSANVDRLCQYPISSLASRRNNKHDLPDSNISYSREKFERYCCSTLPTSKSLVSKGKGSQYPVRYRRPIDYWHRKHVFPNQRKKQILSITGQLLLLKCKQISVKVENMSTESINTYIDKLKEEAKKKSEEKEDRDIEFIGFEDHPVEVNSKVADPLKSVDTDCEVIDLCSDDESGSVNENCDPRAGVTCVMRGGAVLRRTAATPQSIPAEPCGARHKPLPPAILQPHPVILFTHSLSNLQTISLE